MQNYRVGEFQIGREGIRSWLVIVECVFKSALRKESEGSLEITNRNSDKRLSHFTTLKRHEYMKKLDTTKGFNT